MLRRGIVTNRSLTATSCSRSVALRPVSLVAWSPMESPLPQEVLNRISTYGGWMVLRSVH